MFSFARNNPIRPAAVAGKPEVSPVSMTHRSLLCTPVLIALLFNARCSHIDIRRDPALFPRLCAALVKWNSVHSGITAGVEEKTPSFRVIVFPALRENPLVASQLYCLRIGILP